MTSSRCTADQRDGGDPATSDRDDRPWVASAADEAGQRRDRRWSMSASGDAGHPLTAPAMRPRTKYRCKAKNTSRGTTIDTNAAAVSRCHD